MEFELGTQLVKFINVGMYESFLSPEEVLDDEELQDSYWDTFDNKKYVEFIFDCAKDVFELEYLPVLKKLDLNIISGEGTEIYSPKSNNFGSDKFYFNLTIKGTLREAWNKYQKNVDLNTLNSYLKEANKSYDGFSSSMPKSIEDLEDFIDGENKDEERALAAILNYELNTNDDKDHYQEMLMEAVHNDVYLHDFRLTEVVTERFVKTFESWSKNK